MTSGRAWWMAEWITNAARLTGRFPYTTSPLWLTSNRSLTFTWRKLIANGLTQKWSGNSGSRTVMCPATPSPKPQRPKMRSAPASFCLRCNRSSSTFVNSGGPSSATASGVSSMPSIVRTPDSVIVMVTHDTGKMNTEIMPSTIAPPAANYAHAVLSTNSANILHVSGQVAARLDGTVPDDVAEQAEVVWSNIAAILAEAGMDTTDIVSITTYVVADFMASMPQVMAARDAALDGHRAASTLVTVPALARPAWKMEVAIVAAR